MKKLLSTLLFAGIGVGVAAAVDDDFREALVDGATTLKDSVKDKFFNTVDAEEDEEPEEPSETGDEIGPDDLTITPEDLDKARQEMNDSIGEIQVLNDAIDDLPKTVDSVSTSDVTAE